MRVSEYSFIYYSPILYSGFLKIDTCHIALLLECRENSPPGQCSYELSEILFAVSIMATWKLRVCLTDQYFGFGGIKLNLMYTSFISLRLLYWKHDAENLINLLL